MKKNCEASLNLGAYATTAETVKKFLEKIPDDAKIRATISPGDRSYESAVTFLKASWVEEL